MLTPLRLVVALTLAAALLAPATAAAGVVQIVGSTIVYSGDATADQIAVSETPGTFRFARLSSETDFGAGAGCTATEGLLIIDCSTVGVTSMRVELGGDDDTAWVSPTIDLPVTLHGGEGDDSLTGGGGVDIFDGGRGDDSVVARDGRAEQVDCGEGNDAGVLDDTDGRATCERIEGDADGDGVRAPVDCDDTTSSIRPGRVDVPENGIDEDCSGVDAVILDRDQDGIGTPQDCDDRNALIRPGLSEVPGNDLDEDCDTRVEPFPAIAGSLLDAWERDGSRTRNVRLTAKGFPAGTAIELRCSGRGCPFRLARERVGTRSRPVNLHRRFGDRALRPRVRIELRFVLPGHIGRVLRYRMTSRALPEFEFLCLPPGGPVRGC